MAPTIPSSTGPGSPWARLRRTSLWRLLALLLLPVLALVTCVELWMTRHDALEAANAAYDRSLLGALKSIDANISTASGGLSAELPGRPRPHGRPPFATRLYDTQVAALVSWRRASWGHQATPVSVPQVQQARR